MTRLFLLDNIFWVVAHILAFFSLFSNVIHSTLLEDSARHRYRGRMDGRLDYWLMPRASCRFPTRQNKITLINHSSSFYWTRIKFFFWSAHNLINSHAILCLGIFFAPPDICCGEKIFSLWLFSCRCQHKADVSDC